VEDCSVLSRFLIISFADLKKWTFNYWFAFPALMLDPPATVVNLKPASQWFSAAEVLCVSLFSTQLICLIITLFLLILTFFVLWNARLNPSLQRVMSGAAQNQQQV